MEGVLAVIRPRPNVSNTEYRPRLYDILLLDSKTPPGERVKPAKYLPMFSMKVLEDEPGELVLTQLYKLTGGDHGPGIKGERAILIQWIQTEGHRGLRESLSRFSLFCVPVNPHDKLNKKFVDQAQYSPGFYALDYVLEVLNNNSVSFPSATRTLLLHLESWLREKHGRQGAVESLFRSRVEYRIRLTVHNPVFIPSRIIPENEEGSKMGDLPAEIQLTANEALAKMLSIEKCDIVVINPLFGSGLPYKTKVNKFVENNFWPRIPDYSKVTIPHHSNTEEPMGWRDKYPVHSRAAEGDVEGIKELMNKGYQHSKKDSISWAPIHYAAWYGNADVVATLLEAGSSPNISDKDDATPLHLAARKGHPRVAEFLLYTRSVALNATDKDGKTALDICDSVPDHTWKHDQVAKIIQQSQQRPSLNIQVFMMDKTSKFLRLVAGFDTSVKQLNEQMLNEFGMPHIPYADIFTIWICSKSLELQLKPEHKPTQQLENWQRRTVGMLSDADPTTEEPVLKWRRNAKIRVEMERQLLHPRSVDLLFHEAYHNYINALYPCKDQDAIIFASILFCLRYGHLENSSAKVYLQNSKNLQELVPVPILMSKGSAHWAGKILKEYNNTLHGRGYAPQTMKRQFLTHCQNLTVYGSAFFFGSVLNTQSSKSSSSQIHCHIGVNDVGIHIINSQSKMMLNSYKYSEIEWKHEFSMLEIHVIRPEGKSGRNSTRSVTKIFSKQAGLIEYLMQKLSEMHVTIGPSKLHP